MPNPENLKNWPKGVSGNPNGRPRKFISALKSEGYKISEVCDCIQVLLAMTLEELKVVYEDERATVLEKMIAQAIKTSMKNGDLDAIEVLLNRVFGKPKQTVHIPGMTDPPKSAINYKKLSTEVLMAIVEARKKE